MADHFLERCMYLIKLHKIKHEILHTENFARAHSAGRVGRSRVKNR